MTFQQTSFAFDAGEILNIFKPEGWTSFGVVKLVRNIIGIKKVGHGGSLDPFATGVLILCTGRATKKIQDVIALEKEYVGEITLGITTDTLDRTGKITRQQPVGALSYEDVQSACRQFVGTIEQIPPIYSALKINGVRSYKLARRGHEVALKPRLVTIHAIEVLSFNAPTLKIKVVCSKGTYIRSLARDIGDALACGGSLRELTRTRIGEYHISDAWSLQTLNERVHQAKMTELM